MKKQIKLNEAQLSKVVAESVLRVLKEHKFDSTDPDSKEFQQDYSWKLLPNIEDKEQIRPEQDFEYVAHKRNPVVDNGGINIGRVARDSNWNVYDTKGKFAMNALSDNPYKKHQARSMGSTLSQSVHNGMNDFSNIVPNDEELEEVVAESVKKVLNESCWYGDIKPFQTIISAANEIMEKFEYTQNENYDDMGDCDGPDITPQIYKWAEDVAYNAEKWLRYNSRYTPINGGEDW